MAMSNAVRQARRRKKMKIFNQLCSEHGFKLQWVDGNELVEDMVIEELLAEASTKLDEGS